MPQMNRGDHEGGKYCGGADPAPSWRIYGHGRVAGAITMRTLSVSRRSRILRSAVVDDSGDLA